jgi:hypothetical protein
MRYLVLVWLVYEFGLYRVISNKVDKFTALRCTATSALLAAKHMQILPMTQLANNIWNEGKVLPLFTDHRRCCKRHLSICKYLSQLIVSLKNTGTTILLALTAHQTPTFTGWLQQLCYHSCIRLWHSSPWGGCFSDFLGVCSSLAPVSSTSLQ